MPIDTTMLKALAKYATDNDDHKDFREQASKKENFRKALTKELKKNGTEAFDEMSDDDKGYCEGWLALYRLEFAGNGEINDADLVTKVQKQVISGMVDPLSS